MAFDARRYRESLEVPTYIDTDAEGNEVIFTGVLVPFNTVVEYTEALGDLEGKTEAQINDIIRDFILAIQMPEDVMDYLTQLPLLGRLEAILSFFECLRSGVKR